MSKNGLKKIKALVVEDDRTNQMIHQRLLEKLGIENRAVGNGGEAIAAVDGGGCFDLILMDMDMPVMNGVEATRKLRGMGVRCGIAGVSTHTLKDIEKEEYFMEAGPDDYQQKPLTTPKLVSILHKLNLQPSPPST